MIYNFMIPYRDMPSYLGRAVIELPAYLKSKGLTFNLIIVEQEPGNLFNLGKLINVAYDLFKKGECGYKFSNKDSLTWYPVDCMPLDVDFTITTEDAIVFCADDPHYGKAAMYRNSAFARCNGFNNNYWGHGVEDDDMFMRLGITNADLVRRACKMDFIPHEARDVSHRSTNSYPIIQRLSQTHDVMESGLSDLQYIVTMRYKVGDITKVTVSI